VNIPWADYNLQALAEEIGVTSDTFASLSSFKVQFEVNQKLEITLLLCRGKPHYLIASNTYLKITEKILNALERKDLNGQDVPQEIISNGQLQWEIAVGDTEKFTHSVFQIGETFNEDFRNQNDEEPPRKGLISQEPLPPFPNNRKQTFYAIYPSMKEQKYVIPIGELAPSEDDRKENCPYYATIDEQGFLRIHEGEVPYWTSEDQEVLKNKAGCVVLINPAPKGQKDDYEHNPFCGIH
jgi:hypothetical protein